MAAQFTGACTALWLQHCKSPQRVAVNERHSLLDRRMLSQRQLNFHGINAIPTDLCLEICPSQKFDVAALTITSEVACAIQPGSRFAAERIGDKSFRGKLSAIQI